jgi:WD40 repeat protein
MGRRERSLDPAEGPVARFAYELRKLRQEAGGVTYRVMAGTAHYSAATLAQAAAGDRLPSLSVALAYAGACGGDRAEWEQRWRETEREVSGQAREAEDGIEPPYRGLARFGVDDHERFFGRDRLVDQLVALVGRKQLVVVTGLSGSGKSSVLRAGLIARIQRTVSGQERPAAIRVLTPGPSPARTHAGILDPETAPAGTVIVVDQLEEVFTLCADPAERTRFLDLLCDLRSAHQGVRVVVAVRADFYGHLTRHRRIAEAAQDATLLVPPMNHEELREAIVRPAALGGLVVERTLTTRIIRDVADEAGGLPLMSHALLETWRRRSGRVLTEAAYDAAGGIQGAIARTAEDFYGHLTSEQAETARRILLRLVTPGQGNQDTRRPADRGEITKLGPAAASDADLVLDRLARDRLVTLDKDTVHLSHEAVLSAWPRLRAWIEEDRDRLRTQRHLTEATHTWQTLGQDPGSLYRGVRLSVAEEHWTGPGQRDDLTPSEREFLTTSLAARNRNRLQRRSRTAALSVLVVLTLVAALTAWQQNRTSDRRHGEAEARRIAAVADSMRFSDPVTAMKLSVAAWRLADTTETRSALIGAMAQPQEDAFAVPGADAGFDGSGNQVRRLTGDGRSVVSFTKDRVRIWDVRTRRLTLSARGPRPPLDDTPVAVSPDGLTLALLTQGEIKLWDVRTARVTGTLTGVDAMKVPLVFRKHTLVAVDWEGGSVQAWDLRTHRRILRISLPEDSVPTLAASPDGRWLALCQDQHPPQLWDMAQGRKASAPWAVKVRAGDCTDDTLAFTPDSTSITVVAGDGIRGWDLRTGRQTLDLKAEGLTKVWFGSDSGFLVATGPRQLVVWRLVHPSLPVLRQRLTLGDWNDVAVDRVAGAVRYLNGSGTVVRSLAIGTATTKGGVQHPADRAELSEDGQILARFAVKDRARRLQVVDTRDGRILFEPPTPACPSKDTGPGEACADLLALSGDGRYVVRNHHQGASNKTRITVWDVRTGRAHATVDIRPDAEGSIAVNGLALDLHGRTLLVYRATNPLAVEVWDLTREKRVRTIRGSLSPAGGFYSLGVRLALRPDGGSLVTQEGTVTDLRKERMESRVLGDEIARVAAFSPDGTLLAVGDAMGRITLWDGALRTRHGVLDSSSSGAGADTTGGISALAFSHDGGTLAVAGEAGTLQLWDVASSRPLGSTLPTPGDEVLALAFDPDDTTLYAAGTNVSVEKYDLTPEHLVTTVCKRTGSGLSKSDWKTYLPNVPYRHTC